MGYRTRYEVSILHPSQMPTVDMATCEHKFSSKYSYCPDCGKPRFHEVSIEKLIADFISEKHKDWGKLNPFDEECKWYEHVEEMKEFSLKYPEIVFMLHGEGEESGDLWNKYFKNGKALECKGKIIYDDFDEKKLK